MEPNKVGIEEQYDDYSLLSSEEKLVFLQQYAKIENQIQKMSKKRRYKGSPQAKRAAARGGNHAKYGKGFRTNNG